MIESISVRSEASYGVEPEVMSGLRELNFVYGANGSGKTTLSRVLADPSKFPHCGVAWRGGTKLETLVYNQDFVAANFNQASSIKGVFTLGEENLGALAKIAAASAEVDKLTEKIQELLQNLDGQDGAVGKRAELAIVETEIKDKCWQQKQKYDAEFQGAFEGLRNNAEKFKARTLKERSSNTASLAPLAELKSRAEAVFGDAPAAEPSVPQVDLVGLLACELDPILKKVIVGRNDVDIAAMIAKLGNSDWVKGGRVFYDVNGGICPFCQQATGEAFAKSLQDYFDEAFESDSKSLDELALAYRTESAKVQQQVSTALATRSRFLDEERLRAEKALLDSRVTINLQRLAEKRKEPSQVVELETLAEVASAISATIKAAEVLVGNHNKLVANLAAEQASLSAQIWRYLLDQELNPGLDSLLAKRESLEKAVAAIEAKIALATSARVQKVAEIRSLEAGITTVQKTLDDMNGLLKAFGFESFSIAKAQDGKSYKLVRADGKEAKDTLSEGERNFVTFLYFYHLLRGSTSDSGMTANRVVVFDDPVSSLDSDVLFVVGSLIKSLFDSIRSKTGNIKQVFVLTHNVYFHREVAYNNKRGSGPLKEETFWVVRKVGAQSRIQKQESNPIKSSYELLWAEVRKPDPTCLTIQNTLRRILETYFEILGSVDKDDICAKFDGPEKLICNSLFSWVHAGSHHALEDVYISNDGNSVEAFLKVFKEIFARCNQLGHYEMMMGELTPVPAGGAETA